MRRLIYFFTLWLALFTFGSSVPTLSAQTIPATPTDTEKEAAPVTIPKSQRSPRDVLTTFLDRMSHDNQKEAAQLLDLSQLRADAAAAKGPELAYQLYAVMLRVTNLPDVTERDTINEPFDDVSSDPEYDGRWNLSELIDKSLVYVPSDEDDLAKQISITRDDITGAWHFSADTVNQIESLYQATKELPVKGFEEVDSIDEASQPSVPFPVWLREQFPNSWQTEVLYLPIYQWVCLLSIAIISFFVKQLFQREMTWVADKLLQRYDPEFKESTISIWTPVGRLLFVCLLFFCAYIIGLPLSIIGICFAILPFLAIVMAMWSVFAIANVIGGYLTRRAKRNSDEFNHLAISLGTTTIKIIATLAGIVTATAIFKPDWGTTLAGGFGIGGIAIALASQESLSNFIGSLSVLFDSPFVIGDWIIVDGVEGEVESVGFRSTRIRTGMNSQVTIPNSQVAKTHVDNLGRRRYRRYLTRIGVEYKTTTEQMRAFCEGIQELIRRQPHTRKDFYAVYFNDFGDSSLEIILVCYFEVSDWPTELRERHRLLLDIVTLAEQLKVTFAFPTQTVHLYKEEATSRLASIENPETAGQTAAADIAGELLNYQDRPMPVKFPGPTS